MKVCCKGTEVRQGDISQNRISRIQLALLDDVYSSVDLAQDKKSAMMKRTEERWEFLADSTAWSVSQPFPWGPGAVCCQSHLW